MKQIIYLILIISLFSFCLNENNRAFEGIITFDVNYTDMSNEFSQHSTCEFSGDRMNYYINSTGFVKRFYCKDQLINTSWFNSQSNQICFHHKSKDSIFFYSANNDDYEVDIEATDEFEDILDYKCQKIIVTLVPNKSKLTDTIKYHNFIAKKLKINPNPYEKFNEGGYNKLLSVAPGVSLKQVYYGKHYTRTRTANRIQKKSLDLDNYKTKEKFSKNELDVY